MAMRRRRGRSPTQYSDATNAVEAEPLDEDDQKELVESLEKEAAEQTKLFQAMFGFGIGGMAIVFSLIFPVLCPEECNVDRTTAMACWSHSIYSSILNAWVVYPFISRRSLTTKPPSIAIDLVLQTIPIALWFAGFFGPDDDFFHVALFIGNILTFLGARIMYWDVQSTKKSLESLDAARYRHKTL